MDPLKRLEISGACRILDFTELKHEIRSASVAGWTYGSGTISAPGEPEHVDARQISAALFPVLGILPNRGRGFRSNDDRPWASPVAMISYGLWRRRFGSDPGAIGKQLVFDDRTYQIVGVAPPGLQLSGEADVYTPVGQSTDPRMQNREARFIQVMGRLGPSVTFNETQAEVTLIGRHLAEQFPKSDAGVSLRIHLLLQDLVGDVRGTLGCCWRRLEWYC
jgi:hypothetical protein